MGIVETLIAGQRRPDAEALRISTAARESIPSDTAERDGDVAAAVGAWAEVASAAAEEANVAIAEEKRPLRAPAAPAHLQHFLDEDTDTPYTAFDDDAGIPVESATHRTNSRFLLTDEEDSVSDPTPATPAADGAPPWVVDTPADRTATVPEDFSGYPVAPGGHSEIRDSVPVQGRGTAVDYACDEPADPAAVNDDGLDDLGGPADDEIPDSAADFGGGYTYADMPPDPVHARDGANEDDGNQPHRPARWERDPAPVSPWGDAPEVVAEEDTDPADDYAGHQPPPAHRSTDRDAEPAPSPHATAPPDHFDAPEPQPRTPVFSRIGDVLSPQQVRDWFGGPHRPLRIGLIAAGAVLLVVAIVASFMVTGRGRPPEPAVQVAPPPAANDVPAPTAKEQVLIPAQVSASCGNDSDAVAPFANDRTRAWVCKRINGLDLNVLNISFACPVVVTSLTVTPGWNFVAPDGRDEWIRHRLTTGISWRMGGAVYPQAIVPTRTGVTMKVPNVITQEMSATITSSMRPPMGESKSDDFGSKADESAKVDEFTAIGSIKIMGHPVDPGSGLCGPTG